VASVAVDAGDAAPGDGPSAVMSKLIVAGKPGTPGWPLLTSWFRSCSGGEPQLHDRWCAFTRGNELWVINVSVAADQPIDCGGGDRNCRRLTSTVAAIDGTIALATVPTFSDDLLLFSADPAPAIPGPPADHYRGGVYAWRPGWPSARRLTSETGAYCLAARQAAIVACVDNTGPMQFDVLVGAPEEPLRRAARFAQPVTSFELSRGGGHLGLEEPQAKPGPGTVWLIPVASAADPATHVLVTRELLATQHWTLSYDDAALFFLRGNPGNLPRPAGTLAMVPLDRPTAVVELGQRLATFGVFADRKGNHLAVAGLQDKGLETGLLKVYLGLSPPKELTIGSSSENFTLSTDGRYTMFQVAGDPATGRRDLRVATHASGAICTLQQKPNADFSSGDAFSDDGQLAFWTEYPDAREQFGEGWVGRPADCTDRRKFASREAGHFVVNGLGLVFRELYREDGGGVLRFARWDEGTTWPAAAPVTLGENVTDRFVVVDLRDGPAVVFNIGKPGAEGLYLAPLR
jgi:hypothetical protein